MFIMAGLGIYQVVARRCPDILLSVHKAFLILAAILALVVIGVVRTHTHTPIGVFESLFCQPSNDLSTDVL